MLKNFMAGVWRRLPTGLRRMTIRLTNTKFTVTSAAVIFNKEGKVLLLKHRFRPGSGWGLPGGFLKPDEQPLDGLQRELREEIALELDLDQVARRHRAARVERPHARRDRAGGRRRSPRSSPARTPDRRARP